MARILVDTRLRPTPGGGSAIGEVSYFGFFRSSSLGFVRETNCECHLDCRVKGGFITGYMKTQTLYISDLDGTLLNNDARLSDFSRTTLQRLLLDGLPFSVASARSVLSMRPILDGLALTLPVVEFNGAFLSDLASTRHYVINAIEPTLAGDLYQLISRDARVPFISTFNGANDCLYYSSPANGGMDWYIRDRIMSNDQRLRETSDLRSTLRESVICFTVIDIRDGLAELEHAVLERYAGAVETHLFENQYSPGWYWLTVHDRRATKDQAIRTLMQMQGLEGSELVVFGDNINDIKSFQSASVAVAVANASEEVKLHATHIIGSNQEDSVLRYLLEHWSRGRSDPRAASDGLGGLQAKVKQDERWDVIP